MAGSARLKEFSVSIDLKKPKSVRPFEVVDGDTGNRITLTLYDGGTPVDMTGIRVMAVCPGWVTTEFFDHAVSDDTISYYNRYYTPGQVVERALRDMKRGRDVSVCGFQVRAQVLLTKLLPHRWVMAIWCRQQKK